MNKNNPKKIPVFDISIGQQEKDFIKDCLDTSFVGQGPYVKEFENKFSNFVSCKHGITTTSGTTALHLALRTVGVTDGDEVLVSAAQIWHVHFQLYIVTRNQYLSIFIKRLGKWTQV